MGRLNWGIIGAVVLGAVLFGILQRGCRLDADSDVKVTPRETTPTEALPAPAPRPTETIGDRRGNTRTPRSVSPRVGSDFDRNPNRAPGQPIVQPSPAPGTTGDTVRPGQTFANRRATPPRQPRQISPMVGGQNAGQQPFPVPDQTAAMNDALNLALAQQQQGFTDPGVGTAPARRSSARSGERGSEGGETGGETTPAGSEAQPSSGSGQGTGGTNGSFTTVTGLPPTTPPPGGGGGGQPTPPASFTLTAPADSATRQPRGPTFTWAASTGATSYRIRVSTSAGLAAPVIDQTITATSFTAAANTLQSGTRYFWSVTASNAAGSASPAAAFSFTTLAAPGAFRLTSPSSGAQGLTGPVTLAWSASAEAAVYTVTVARDAAFESVVLQTAGAATTATVASSLLQPGTTYHWRVVAANPAGTRAPEPASATFSTLGAPGPFVLLNPAAGASDVLLPAVLAWTPSPGAASYRVEIATDAAFSARVLNVGGITTTSYLVPADALSPGTTYFWRVSASNAVDVAGSTPAFLSFTTIALPGDFALLSPGDEGASTLPVTLDWQDSEGALLYTVEVSANASFTDIVLRELVVPLLSGSSLRVADGVLEAGRTYYWRVRAGNVAGEKFAAVSPFAFRVREADYDLNGDGLVDVRDLYAFHALPAPKPDLNLDGVVNDADRLSLRDAVRANEREDVAPGRP